MTSIVESCSTGKKLLLALCSTALLAFAATGCADSGGGGSDECDEGEQLFQDYPNQGDEGCYQPCDSASDCPSGFECVNSTLCAEDTGGGTGDVMTGDGGMPDTGNGTGGNGDDTSNGGNGDDGGGSGSKSCEEIETCTSKCANDDTDCQSQCVMDASTEGQNNWQAINDCASMNCGEMSAPTCIQDNCEQELRTCGIVDNATCKDLQVCNTKCLQRIQGENPNADQQTLIQLFRECLAEECPEGSIDAQKQNAEINACRSNNCPTDDDSTAPDCRWQNCQSQYEACKDGEGGNAFGDKSCREVDIGVSECGTQMSADYQCEAEEIWSGTKKARALRDKWSSCLGSCFQDKFPNNTEKTVKCIYEEGEAQNSNGETKQFGNCKQYRDKCNEIGTDNQTCEDILTCLNSSGSLACEFDATAEAQADWWGWRICASRNDCITSQGIDPNCVQNNCQSWEDKCKLLDQGN